MLVVVLTLLVTNLLSVLSSATIGPFSAVVISCEDNGDDASCPSYRACDKLGRDCFNKLDHLSPERMDGSPAFPYNQACWVYAIEKDGGDFLNLNNDLGWIALKPGTVFGGFNRLYDLKSQFIVESFGDNEDDDITKDNDAAFIINQLPWTSAISYVCDEKSNWNTCSNEGDSIKINLGKNEAGNEATENYYCLMSGPYKSWFSASQIFANIDPALDADEDKVPDFFDCAPNDFTVHGEFNCQPKLDENKKEIINLLTGKPELDCAKGVASSPEICGDNIDNDCSGWNHQENYKYIGSQIEDSCNLIEFKSSCLSNCRTANNKCDWIDLGPNTGMCCGANSNDLGKIVTGTGSLGNGNYLCVTKEKESLGFEGNGELPFGWPENTERCSGQWCLLEAGSAAKFNVMTVKKPVLENEQLNFQVYDVVSNGQNWLECSSSSLAGRTSSQLAKPSERGADESLDSLQRKANRFACFKEGDHYSWVECGRSSTETEPNTHTNKGIKSRRPGEGFYTLPLDFGGIVEETPPLFVIDINSRTYKNYYGNNQGDSDFLFDFTGYDTLNFMVKFKEISKIPAAVSVTILGPGGEENVYFKKQVLGEITNSPFFKDSFMHVEVDIPGLKAVRQVRIESSNQNIIVRNVYLSNSANSFLCTGQEAVNEWSWITDIDQGDTSKLITAENLCKSLYGNEAWLGNDNQVEVSGRGFNCCGNTKKEYYAGESRPVGDVANPDYYSCWNSQPVKSGDTVMEVEFKAGYKEDKFLVSYAPLEKEVSYMVEKEVEQVEEQVECRYTCQDLYANVVAETGNTVACVPVNDAECNAGYVRIVGHTSYGQICYIYNTDCNFNQVNGKLSCKIDYATRSGKRFDLIEDGKNKETVKRFVEGVSNNRVDDSVLEKQCPVHVMSSTGPLSQKSQEKISFPPGVNAVIIDQFSLPSTFKEIKLKTVTTSEGVDLVFYYASQVGPLSEGLTKILPRQVPINEKVYVVAVLDQEKINYPSQQSVKTIPPQPFSFACQPDAKGECLFPLPGNPPYQITNEHPGLYELYFVTGDTADKETLITNSDQLFNEAGNIKARKVSEQVVFVRESPPDGSIKASFYGCSAADFLLGNNKIQANNNLNHCSIKAGAYCAYLHTSEKGTATVNSWSKTILKEYRGIDPIAGEQPGLQIIAKEFPPEKLNGSSAVVPGKNILTNAEFKEFAGNSIPGWDILEKQNQALIPVRNKQSFIRQRQDELSGKITIPATHILRSDWIPVKRDLELQFSITSESCKANLLVVDKDGLKNVQEVQNGEKVNVGEAAYVQLELTACQFKEVMLQSLDQLGAAPYSFQNPQAKPRAGAACCPQNYCWDGAHCVEPMNDYTSISEEVEEGRNYRCIAGNWVYQQIKTDWKQNLQGFCNAQEQCLVRPSTDGGEARFKANDFYEGNVPTCINNQEYLFDNYCDRGNWSSRTKFLAEQLLSRVGDDKDHSLYCTQFKDVFTNLNDNQKSLLQGVELSTAALVLGQEQSTVCFPAVAGSVASELITDEENTCINNACVLLFNDKTALATTLNKPLDDPNSVIAALERSNPACTGSGDFKNCQNGLFHSEQLNAIWFSKDGLEPEAGLGSKIYEFFQGLFSRRGDLTTKEFFSKVKNFREVYSAKDGPRRVLALQEQTSRKDKTLVAEFENFDTPICEYAAERRIDKPELNLELLEAAAGVNLISCTVDDDIQRVEAVKANEFLWPELTGKLRVGVK